MATVTPIPAALGVNCHDTLQNMYSTTLPPRPKVVTATQFASDDFKVQTLPSPSRAAFLRPEGLGLFTHTYPSNGLWPSKGSKEQTVSFENKLLTVQVITAAEGFVLISTSQLPRQISHVCFRTLLLTNNLARRTRGRCRVTRIRENRSRGECIDGCSQSTVELVLTTPTSHSTTRHLPQSSFSRGSVHYCHLALTFPRSCPHFSCSIVVKGGCCQRV